MKTNKERKVPIRIDGEPDPNAHEGICKRIGHDWVFDKLLRCYICRNCNEIDR